MSMSCCVCPPEAGAEGCELSALPSQVSCPVCGEVGKRVEPLTLKAMLARPLTELRNIEYRFCRTSDCPIVYYSTDGRQQFYEDDLRERVHQKHQADAETFVCYCFRHTPGSIRAEWLTTGRSTVVERITAGVQAGQCACEIRNPQGSCCLGNVRAVVRQMEQKMHERHASPA